MGLQDSVQTHSSTLWRLPFVTTTGCYLLGLAASPGFICICVHGAVAIVGDPEQCCTGWTMHAIAYACADVHTF